MTERARCWWCGDDPLYQQYHDHEWGEPLHDERALFEFLCLEGAQAGLSWITILRKRENYKKAFDDFDAEKIARYSDKRVARLLQDPGIVRNRLKVNGFVKNARAYLAMREEGLTFDSYFWDFVDGEPLIEHTAFERHEDAELYLEAGMHDIRVRYLDNRSHSRIYLYWQLPGGVRQLIPFEALFLPQEGTWWPAP